MEHEPISQSSEPSDPLIQTEEHSQDHDIENHQAPVADQVYVGKGAWIWLIGHLSTLIFLVLLALKLDRKLPDETPWMHTTPPLLFFLICIQYCSSL